MQRDRRVVLCLTSSTRGRSRVRNGADFLPRGPGKNRANVATIVFSMIFHLAVNEASCNYRLAEIRVRFCAQPVLFFEGYSYLWVEWNRWIFRASVSWSTVILASSYPRSSRKHPTLELTEIVSYP